MKRSPDGRIVASAHFDRSLFLWDPHTGELIRKIDLPIRSSPASLQFSPDGRLLFGLSSYDYFVVEVETGLVWFHQSESEPDRDKSFAVMGRGMLLSGETLGTARLWKWAPLPEDEKPQPLEKLWREVSSDDGPTVCRSMFALADRGDQTVEFLAQRLSSDRVPQEKILSLVKNLGDDSPVVRRKASEELRRLGSPTRPQLQAALEDENLSPRVQARIKLLMSAMDSEVSPELLAVQAVQLLEWIATPKARALIQEWAKEPAGRLGKEAQAALKRLSPAEQ